MAAALSGGAGCGDGGEAGRLTAGDFSALSGAAVIDLTREAGTATGAIDHHQSAADPPEDHGALGRRPFDLHMDVEFDFARNRALVEWVFPANEVLGEVRPPVRVEARTVEDITYVRDGSWLCPGCGLDGDEPLPTDMWLQVPGPTDAAFDFDDMTSFAGLLGWIELVEAPVEPKETATVDGTPVGVYELTVPNADVEARMPDDGSGYDLQGEAVTLTFMADQHGRLRQLTVALREDDRDTTMTAELGDFGTPVSIEAPPDGEIYRGRS